VVKDDGHDYWRKTYSRADASTLAGYLSQIVVTARGMNELGMSATATGGRLTGLSSRPAAVDYR
jgi:hypothetical protein